MTDKERELRALARFEFGELSQAEEVVLQEAERGNRADVSALPEQDRIVRANFLAWLCREPTTIAMLRTCGGLGLTGATIGGVLDLSYSTAQVPLLLLNCVLPHGLHLRNARIPEIAIIHSRVGDVLAGRLVTDGTVQLLRTRVDGMLDLLGCRIGGNLDCNGSTLLAQDALRAEQAKIEGSVLLNDGFMASGGVDFRSAAIGGDLQCEDAQFLGKSGFALAASFLILDGNLLLRGKRFRANGVDLRGARIRGQFEAQDAHFANSVDGPALAGDSLEIGGTVFLEGTTASGEIRLAGGRIGWNLQGDRARFESGFFAPGVKVGGDTFLRDTRVVGGVNLAAAMIGGNLECDHGHFEKKDSHALTVEQGQVKGSLFLRAGFRAEGQVNLMAATIGKDLSCSNGYFLSKNSYAILGEQLEVHGKVFMHGAQIDGTVSFARARIAEHFGCAGSASAPGTILDLRYAKVGAIWDDEASWPQQGNLWINGLTYNELDSRSPMSSASRLQGLRLQPSVRFYSQPYEQLAAAYEQMGRSEDARVVLIKKNQDPARLRDMGRLEKMGHRLLGWTIGFGYRPFRAAWLICGFILLGSLLFGEGYRNGIVRQTEEWKSSGELIGNYPEFSSFLYSVDMFVPVIDLHLKKYWLPDSTRGAARLPLLALSITYGSLLRVYLVVHILAGWILTTLFVVGVTGLVKK